MGALAVALALEPPSDELRVRHVRAHVLLREHDRTPTQSRMNDLTIARVETLPVALPTLAPISPSAAAASRVPGSRRCACS